MNKILLILSILFLFTGKIVFSQVLPGGGYSIKGVVIDSALKKPAVYITVSLVVDGKVAKSYISEDNGSFQFENVNAGKYTLIFSSVEFTRKSMPVIFNDSTAKALNVGEIRLNKDGLRLEEVKIKGNAPSVIKREIDRISYNVQADPEKNIQSGLELLRKVPLLSVSAQQKVELNGNTNFRILINGRPSSMMDRNAADVLKSMPASSIQRIEVITTPPSKYDGEGLAGIINIITNKKIGLGYEAGVTTAYNTLGEKRLSGSLAVQGNKITVSSVFGSGWQDNPVSMFKNSQLGTSTIKTLSQEEGKTSNSTNSIYGNAEISYEIDSLNLITGIVGLYRNNDKRKSEQNYQLIDNGIVQQSNLINYASRENEKSSDFELNYQRGFKRNKEQLLTGSYKYTKISNSEDNTNIATQRYNFTNNDRGQQNTYGADEQTGQLDYVHPLKNINIEGGAKLIARNSFSDYLYKNFVPVTGELLPGSVLNSFKYGQNIYALYNSYQVKLEDWGLKFGMRFERTTIKANLEDTASRIERGYNNFIPEIVLQRKFKNLSTLSIGYTQRIQRPGILQLNPFINKSNTLFWEQGNPDLLPVLNHNFELTYNISKKATFNLAVNYLFANNTIQQVVTLGADSISRYKYENLGKNNDLGVNVFFGYPITSELKFNLNGRISYVWLKGNYDGKFYENEGFKGNANLYFSYNFKNNYRAALNFGTYSPELYLQGRSRSSVSSSLSINKEFFNNKLSVAASVSNPFENYRDWRTKFVTNDFTSEYLSTSRYRRFDFSISYRFGGLKDAIKKNKRGINNDDTIKD